jgi:hypothetical protein
MTTSHLLGGLPGAWKIGARLLTAARGAGDRACGTPSGGTGDFDTDGDAISIALLLSQELEHDPIRQGHNVIASSITIPS